MSGKDERKESIWIVRICACGQKYWVTSRDEQTVCHSCEGVRLLNERQAGRMQERRGEARNRYPYLRIPTHISPIDRMMLEQGSEPTIRKYKRLWSRRTETGSMDVLLIDAADRVFKYIHIGPTGFIDCEEEVEPMIQIVPYTALEEVGDWVTSLEEAADRIRLARLDRLIGR